MSEKRTDQRGGPSHLMARRCALATLAGGMAAAAAGWRWRNRSGDAPPAPPEGAAPSDASPDTAVGTASAVGHPACFYVPMDEGRARCEICFRRCVMAEGERGFCRVRENRMGKLFSLVYGRPCAVQAEPVEKEPLHHFLPGSDVLCIGTAGCNFRCLHCHNWHMSQASPEDVEVHPLPPSEAVLAARRASVPAISFTYNDPIVFAEYVRDVARLARDEGLRIIVHTNGSFHLETLRILMPLVDAWTVDLKSVTDDIMRRMSGAPALPTLDALKAIAESGAWLELVHLMVTDMNDAPDETQRVCAWVVEHLGRDVPLHLSRFFPNFRYTRAAPTPIDRLERAWTTAREAGIRYVSIGNLPGHRQNSTFCPSCDALVIRRRHFEVLENRLQNGACASCGRRIPGVWS